MTNARVRLAGAPLAKSALVGVGSPRRVFLPASRPNVIQGKRVRRPEPYVASKRAAFQPGDEQVGAYSHEERVRMNARFVERVERAIAAGDESPQGTTGLASAR